jgi:hypothetical protein
MTVVISKYDPKRKDKVIEAARELWTFDDFLDTDKTVLESTGQENLCGGETEEEFADRLTKAVWEANEKYCIVEVRSTFMEELPYTTHIRGKAEYERQMKRKPKCAKRSKPTS